MRAELLGQIVGAQFELERAMAETPITARAEGAQQLQALKDLQRQIGSANPATLHALRADIATAVAVAHATIQQGQSAAASAEGMVALAEAARVSREQTQSISHDLYERKVLDPYLRFSSAEDEEAYRRREQETRRAIETALAEHTPEGNLRAAYLVRSQLTDAGNHGADASPEFARMIARNGQSIDGLESALRREKAGPQSGAIGEAKIANTDTTKASDGKLSDVLASLQSLGVEGGKPADHAHHGLSKSAVATDRFRAGPA